MRNCALQWAGTEILSHCISSAFVARKCKSFLLQMPMCSRHKCKLLTPLMLSCSRHRCKVFTPQMLNYLHHRCKLFTPQMLSCSHHRCKLLTPDCTGTLLLLAIYFIAFAALKTGCHPHPASQLDRFLLSSTSSSSSPLAIVLGGGLGGKLSRLSPETKCCGGFHHPAGSFSAHKTDTEPHKENPIHNERINYTMRITATYVKIHSLMCTIKPQNVV